MAVFTVVSNADNGAGSLRDAIIKANATPGADTIAFNIAPTNDLTIALQSALPEITDTVDIDGRTQPGYGGSPIVILNGIGAGAGADGLRFTSSGNAVRGLMISGFGGTAGGTGGRGILLTGGQNLIQNSYIGTDASGQSAYPNRIGIEANSTNNTIGGASAGEGNVVSGNTRAGIALLGPNGGGNFVQGNFVGTRTNGTGSVANGVGVYVATPTNVIGGEGLARNVIAGNAVAGSNPGIGLYFDGTASHNLVQGNYIGLDATGLAASPNDYGIQYGPNFAPVAGLTGNTIGGTVNTRGNFISGNKLDGIALGRFSGTQIIGNFIGIDAAGKPLGNGGNGVSVVFASGSTAPLTVNNTIGGTSAGQGNLIRYNGKAGVRVANTSGGAVSGVSIRGNFVSDNGQLGIDIGPEGVTPGYLFVNSAANSPGGVVVISGVFHGAPNSTYLVDVFSNASADPSGYGQGESFLATAEPITTDILGNATFSVAIRGATQPIFTATVTDASGSTSEFSPAFPTGATEGQADLLVFLTGPTGTVPSGSNVTLTATIVNNGPAIANGVVFSDLLPPGLTILSATTSVGTVTFDGSGAIAADIGTLARGGTATITILVSATQTGSLTNAASAFSTTIDSNYANNQATQVVTVLPPVNPTADLAISQTSFAAGGKVVGQNIVYTITVSNNGPNVATGVIATDFIPRGQRFLAASSSQGSSSFANGIVTTNLGTLLIGGSATIQVTVALDQAGPATNVANVMGTLIDNVTGNNSSTLVDQIGAPAVSTPLNLTQTFSPARGAVGQPLTVTLTVTNPNAVPAAGVVLNDVLPTNAQFAGATPSVGSFSVINGVLSANFGTLAPGASASIVITLVPTATGTVINNAITYVPGSPSTSSAEAVRVGGEGPTVTGITPVGNGNKLNKLVISFDTPLNAASARRKANYRLFALGGAIRNITPRDRQLPIRLISYNAATNEVTITLGRALPRSQYFRLVAVGKSSAGIKDLAGNRLDGAGAAGTNYIANFFGAS